MANYIYSLLKYSIARQPPNGFHKNLAIYVTSFSNISYCINCDYIRMNQRIIFLIRVILVLDLIGEKWQGGDILWPMVLGTLPFVSILCDLASVGLQKRCCCIIVTIPVYLWFLPLMQSWPYKTCKKPPGLFKSGIKSTSVLGQPVLGTSFSA